MFILASVLQPGDSGGALVNLSGGVIGVAFAIAPDKPDTAYALSTKEVQAALAEQSAVPVSTKPACQPPDRAGMFTSGRVHVH